jgi:AcrR family transcriptional regulator
VSQSASASSKKHSGPKRNPDTHRAIIDAAEHLLGAEGYLSFSLEKVALRAGVGKQTIYKWWGSKPALVLEVFHDRLLPPVRQYNGEVPYQKFIKSTLLEFGKHLTRRDYNQAVICLLAEMHANPKLSELSRTSVFIPRLKYIHEGLDLAIKRGDILPDIDPNIVTDELYGAIWYQVMIRQEPVTTKFVGTLVDQVLAGIGAR